MSRFDGQESNGIGNDTGSKGASRAGLEKGVRQDSGKSRTKGEGKGIRPASEGGTIEAQGFEPAP